MNRRTSLSTVLSIVMLVAVAYAAVVFAAIRFQSRLVFFPNLPSRVLGPGPDSIGLDGESLKILTEDGVRLHAWYLPVPEPRGTVLSFHGNAGNISHRLDTLRILHQLNLATLILNYRGYGESDGEPSEQGLYRDAEAAWRYLTEERGVPPEQVVVFGRSLGAAVAAYVASRHEPGALILKSGFVSVSETAAQIYPWLPARWLTRIHFPAGEFLQSVTCPVLVMHSREDETGTAPLELAPRPKHLLELQGGHNEGFLLSGRRYTDGLDALIAASLGR